MYGVSPGHQPAQTESPATPSPPELPAAPPFDRLLVPPSADPPPSSLAVPALPPACEPPPPVRSEGRQAWETGSQRSGGAQSALEGQAIRSGDPSSPALPPP